MREQGGVGALHGLGADRDDRGGVTHGATVSLQFMDVVQDAPRDADGQDRQPTDGLVRHPPGHVHDHALVQLDLLVVQEPSCRWPSMT